MTLLANGKKNNKIGIIFYLLLLVLQFQGCKIKPVYFSADKNIAEKKVSEFHNLLDEQKYDSIYELTDKQTKEKIKKDDFVLMLKNVYFTSGKIKSSQLIDSKVTPQSSSRIVELTYQTNFENMYKKEKFYILIADELASISSYELLK